MSASFFFPCLIGFWKPRSSQEPLFLFPRLFSELRESMWWLGKHIEDPISNTQAYLFSFKQNTIELFTPSQRVKGSKSSYLQVFGENGRESDTILWARPIQSGRRCTAQCNNCLSNLWRSIQPVHSLSYMLWCKDRPRKWVAPLI